jgi:4-hydroxy-4-methyl-2-oxoglutarate aldolase
MTKTMPDHVIELLRGIDSPTISNAIEKFQVRNQTEGYASGELICRFPELPPIVGYAVTCIVDTTSPEPAGPNRLADLFDIVASAPKPAVVVMQNQGPRRARSCMVGDLVCTSLHKLGVAGLMTDGGVRDLGGIRKRAPGFQVFAAGVVVSHGLPTYLDVNTPVAICGLPVRPGELLHGDESGVVSIPLEIVEQVVEQAKAVLKKENELIDFLNSASFNLEELKYRITH